MPEPLVIAVVGHTNAGKTSLLRTLTRRRDFGEVSPRPGATRHTEAVDLVAQGRVLVEFWDTPGLEDALRISIGKSLGPTTSRATRPMTRISNPPTPGPRPPMFQRLSAKAISGLLLLFRPRCAAASRRRPWAWNRCRPSGRP